MGNNEFGQLGQGLETKSIKNKNLPCLVESLADYYITIVSSGNYHSLCLSENGVVFAWG
jgi:alpha-tubulin suppressor-like RCC1 family protein